MTVRELDAAFSTVYPPALRAEWDNDGLMCSPDPEGAVYKILCVLDVTDEVIAVAEKEGFDTVISHHPLIFRPVRAIAGGKLSRLLRAGISVLSYHTRADAAPGGVNDLLCRLLGLRDVVPFSDGVPRIGNTAEPMSREAFFSLVRRATGAPFLRVGGAAETISRVAVCGGAGKDYAEDAAAAGADLYLSGELGYHTLLEPPCLMAEIGHDRSEMQIVGAMAAAARRFCPGAKVTELPVFPLSVLPS